MFNGCTFSNVEAILDRHVSGKSSLSIFVFQHYASSWSIACARMEINSYRDKSQRNTIAFVSRVSCHLNVTRVTLRCSIMSLQRSHESVPLSARRNIPQNWIHRDPARGLITSIRCGVRIFLTQRAPIYLPSIGAAQRKCSINTSFVSSLLNLFVSRRTPLHHNSRTASPVSQLLLRGRPARSLDRSLAR